MKIITRFYRKWIADFWRPKPVNDVEDMMFAVGDLWLEELAQEHGKLREDRIRMLIIERDSLRKSKKKHSHLQSEIESLRTQQLGG